MGGRGGSGGNSIKIGTPGIGITFTGQTKLRDTTYYADNYGIYRGLQTGNQLKLSNQNISKLLKEGKIELIPKSQMKAIRERRIEKRENRPDYELGNVFQEHGWAARKKKLTYR